jgi:hypothetical protein
MSRQLAATALATLMLSFAAATPAAAQTSAIEGRIVDEQAASVPGVTVTILGRDTGLTRVATTDRQGAYRLAGVPVGRYDVRAELAGFATMEQRDTIVDVSAIVRVDFALRIAAVTETVDVAARTPLLRVASAAVAGVVDSRRIEELPLNGRQFANLAGTLPGVGVGFHRDPTKSSQYMPQVAGGNGRNVNYIVDGGDNNDDTVGGPLQQFPLDAIEEFRFSIATFSAEFGRASGGVMTVVTKSGSNRLAGAAFNFLRHEQLNSRTTTEERAGVPKSDYRRWQYGGSLGGPVVQNTAHFFAAVERAQQNTFQAVDTRGLFPLLDGVFPVAYSENLLTGKVTINAGRNDRLTVRYGGNTNAQPEGAGPLRPPQSWGVNRNRFHSVNASHSRTLGTTAFNELDVQYATFANAVTANTDRATETFPNGVIVGQDPLAPQSTEQRKLHLRDDVSWHVTGRAGLAHDFKTGVAWTYEPHLGQPPIILSPSYLFYAHATNDPNGPLTAVNGNTNSTPIELAGYNIPLQQLGIYVQDDWHATNRLTLNVGVRYDLGIGYTLDQSRNPNFAVLQQAAKAGRFANVIGLEDFGQPPRNDTNNIQPRVGFAVDLHGNGTDVIRGGWGIYTDAAYTNANLLFAAVDARGPLETPGFSASNPDGIRKPDGTFFRVGDPLSTIAALNESGVTGLNGEVVSPRFEQPYTRQTSVGWSHQLGKVAAFDADYVHADGRDLSLRLRLNSRPNLGPRRFGDLPLDPNSANFRTVTSDGTSRYDALILSVRRRTTTGIDVAASYTLARAISLLGQAVDETGLGANTILDVTNPFAPAEYGPANADARHRASVSAIIPVGWGLQIAPIVSLRSALPVTTIEGVDRNRDSVVNDLPDRSYAYDGSNRPPKDIGACSTINCGRGSRFSQLNVRVSKRFTLPRGARIEAIAELFNAFNASNPGALNARRLLGPNALNGDFMQPASFAGDFQQPEQRVGQLGVRWVFGK